VRRDQTEVERTLWGMLRNRQLGGYKFRRQYPIDRYIADFACAEAKLVIELDALERAGWQVIRFWNGEVFENAQGVAETILHTIQTVRN